MNKSLEGKLTCPHDKTVLLDYRSGRWFCPKRGCTCGYHGGEPPELSDKPVLINPSNSIFTVDSILNEGGESKVKRPNFLLKKISEIVFGSIAGVQSRFSFLKEYLKPDFKVLVVGGGEETKLVSLVRRECNKGELINVDVYYSENVDIIADAHDLPFKDQSFDLVIIQAVLEHVISPNQVVQEIYRVLKSGGFVYAETPFMQQVHEGPYDFFRFTKSAHRWLFRSFKEVESDVLKGPFTGLLWSLRYAFYGILGNKRIALIPVIPLFWIRYLDYFVNKQAKIDGASELYFFGNKSEEEFPLSEIVNYYTGKQQ